MGLRGFSLQNWFIVQMGDSMNFQWNLLRVSPNIYNKFLGSASYFRNITGLGVKGCEKCVWQLREGYLGRVTTDDC